MGEIYVDLIGIADFLGHLVERAREWFSSQHGDRFILSVKDMIEAKFPDTVSIEKKRLVRARDRSMHECDLLISTRRTTFVVECKAHAKSAAFFRGDPSALKSRFSQLSEDYKQAQAAWEAVNDAIARGDFPSVAGQRVDYCVCTPSQEFMKLVDKYGWLADGIPSICTTEELCCVIANNV